MDNDSTPAVLGLSEGLGVLVDEHGETSMLKLTHLDRALRQEELQQRAPTELRSCCGTRLGQPHSVRCPEHPLGRHCQNGGDVCLAGNADGVCCPEDSCDIYERVRVMPNG